MKKLKFLTPEQRQFWKDNGYLKVGGIYSKEEMEEISYTYTELFQSKQRENMDMESAWIGDEMMKAAKNIDYTVKSIHALQMHNAVFTRAITHPKLLDALEDIMDTENILLHHTKAHLKPPEKGAPYLMHQDYHYFPFKNHSMLAVFLHLDDTSPENGGLAIYPGSHKLGPLEDFGTTDKITGEAYHWCDPQRFPLEKATPVHAKKGDVVFFSYLTLHGSYLNVSNRPRRMFLIQVRAAEDEPVANVHKSPCQDLVLRGRNIKRNAAMVNRFEH